MIRTMGKTLFVLVFALALSVCSAQTVVYDYSAVEYSRQFSMKALRQLTITSTASGTEVIDLAKTESKDSDLLEFFKKIQELEVKGWVLFDTEIYVYPDDHNITKYVWVMRRPKP